jgi:protein-L-isoaspartate(D-aspartate) O-methyltransferase
LADFGKSNVERLGYAEKVTYLQEDASEGLPGEDPFDLIIVTSAAPEIPDRLVKQIKPRGTLLIPIGDSSFFQQLIRVKKKTDGRLSQENLGGVAFVPMRGKRGWSQ